VLERMDVVDALADEGAFAEEADSGLNPK